MFDTIVYLPTILAYVFISLLIIILCFIVVYVSHKIYVAIYDNLPVAHAALSTILSMDYKDDNTYGGIAVRSSGSFRERKPKTALRIIVILKPSYLAYVVYDNSQKPSTTSDKFTDTYYQNKIVKYYDRLSQIPIAETETTNSRKLKSIDLSSSNRTKTSIVPSRMGLSIKSVATSTTRLSTLTEVPETQANNNDQTEVAITSQGQSAVFRGPSVTFVNAVNALAKMKITRHENLM